MNQYFPSNLLSKNYLLSILPILAIGAYIYYETNMLEQIFRILASIAGVIITMSISIAMTKIYITIRKDHLVIDKTFVNEPKMENKYRIYSGSGNTNSIQIMAKVGKNNISRMTFVTNEMEMEQIKEKRKKKNSLFKKLKKDPSSPEIVKFIQTLAVKNDKKDIVKMEFKEPIEFEKTTSLRLAIIKEFPPISTIYISPKDPDKVMEAIQRWQH